MDCNLRLNLFWMVRFTKCRNLLVSAWSSPPDPKRSCGHCRSVSMPLTFSDISFDFHKKAKQLFPNFQSEVFFGAQVCLSILGVCEGSCLMIAQENESSVTSRNYSTTVATTTDTTRVHWTKVRKSVNFLQYDQNSSAEKPQTATSSPAPKSVGVFHRLTSLILENCKTVFKSTMFCVCASDEHPWATHVSFSSWVSHGWGAWRLVTEQRT